MNIDPEDQLALDGLIDEIANDDDDCYLSGDARLNLTGFLWELIQRRRSGDIGKLAFRDAAVRELVLLEDAVKFGLVSQAEYEHWEHEVAQLAYDPEDLAERALVESAFEHAN